MDQKLFLLINREWTSPALDVLMATLSSIDFWLPVFAVLIVCVAVFGGFRARAFLVTLALVLVCSDSIVANGLKHAVNRPRPNQVFPGARTVDFEKITPRMLALFHPLHIEAVRPETGVIAGRSFPSGHTMNNFAAAVVMAAFWGRRAWAYFLVAAGVGYSRIYTGAHWPTDVLTSTFLGIGVGLLVVGAAEACWNKFGARMAPKLHGQHPRLWMGNNRERNVS